MWGGGGQWAGYSTIEDPIDTHDLLNQPYRLNKPCAVKPVEQLMSDYDLYNYRIVNKSKVFIYMSLYNKV